MNEARNCTGNAQCDGDAPPIRLVESGVLDTLSIMFRFAVLLLLFVMLGACAQPAPRTEPAAEAPAIPKIGVVGLVQEQRQRALNSDNWKTAIAGVIRNSEKDHNANVVSLRYEVTVFYEAGEQGTVVVDEDPGLRPGQRVRVTGNRIEVLTH